MATKGGFEAKKYGTGEPERFNLEIGIKNFGPISEGNVSLKPLTIFIGPNNSGKSYTAMLIYSVLKAYSPISMFGTILRIIGRKALINSKIDINAIINEIAALKEEINTLKFGEELKVPTQTVQKIINGVIEYIYEEKLSEEIMRSYACHLSDLIHTRKKSFKLKIGFGPYYAHLEYKRDNFKIIKYPKLQFEVKFKLMAKKSYSFVFKNKNEVLINPYSFGLSTEKTVKSIYYYQMRF